MSNWSLSRRLISRAGNLYVRLVLGLPVHDTTAGFKAFRGDALERLGAVESASNGTASRSRTPGARPGSASVVPFMFTDRTVGTSKMSGSIVAEALTRVLVWRWNELLDRAGQGSGTTVPLATLQEQPPSTRPVRRTRQPSVMRCRELVARLLTREVLTFFAVGGTG